jgi:hypothetical protein
MNTEFVYSVLYYSHSPFTNERLNVGVLLYFKDQNKIIFKYPVKGFKKFREIYSDFEEWQLNIGLKSISDRVWYLNNERGLFADVIPDDEILNSILIKDSTALKFCKLSISFSELEDINIISEQYYSLYFSEYGSPARKEKHDESYILKTFKSRLFSENNNAQNYLQKDTVINAPKTSVKFDYVWYNGRPNLVKPISFDLEDESTINHKAIFHYAQLTFVSEEIKKYDASINFLITAPNSNRPSLKSAYKKAVEILSDINIKKEIIDENNLDSYVEHVSKAIHAPTTLFPQKNLWGRSGDNPILPLLE